LLGSESDLTPEDDGVFEYYLTSQAVEKWSDARRTKLAPAKAGVHVIMRRTSYAAVTQDECNAAGGRV
jgi:hypothetical protein